MDFEVKNGTVVTTSAYRLIPPLTLSGRVDITTVDLPEGVESIGARAFALCPNLIQVYLPSTLKEIRESAFMGCHPEVSFVFNGTAEAWRRVVKDSGMAAQSVRFIGDSDAFPIFHSDIATVCISKDVTSIDVRSSAFNNNVEWVVVEDGNPRYKVVDNILYTSDDVLVYCPNARVGTVTVPEGVIAIAEYAFLECGITGIYLPSTLQVIGGHAFAACGIREIEIPGGVKDIGSEIFDGCMSLQKVILCEGIEYLSDGLFNCCTKLTDVTLPSTLRVYGRWAFNRCSSLEQVQLAGAYTELPEMLFYGCPKLSRVDFGSKLTCLLRRTFFNCPELVHFTYGGTSSEWDRVIKHKRWHNSSHNVEVACRDKSVVEESCVYMMPVPKTRGCGLTASVEDLCCKLHQDIELLVGDISTETLHMVYLEILEDLRDLYELERQDLIANPL